MSNVESGDPPRLVLVDGKETSSAHSHSRHQIRGGRAPSAEQQQGLSITFFKICTKRKNLYVLLSWISSSSNEEAGMTEQQRVPWDLNDSWSNPRCWREQIFVGRPNQPTATVLNTLQKPRRLDVMKDNTRERFSGYSRKRFNIKTSPYWLVLDLIYKPEMQVSAWEGESREEQTS